MNRVRQADAMGEGARREEVQREEARYEEARREATRHERARRDAAARAEAKGSAGGPPDAPAGDPTSDQAKVAGHEAAYYRFRPEDHGWEGVERKAYAEAAAGRHFAGIERQVIIGHHSGQPSMQLRYFEVAPGGHSALEKHRHEHLVIGARGVGHVIVGHEVRELREKDALYIGPNTPHQFVNTGTAPFGFFCVVASERDRPRDLDPGEQAAIDRDPRARALVRRAPAESI